MKEKTLLYRYETLITAELWIKIRFLLLSSPLSGAYVKQWYAGKDTRTLSGTRVTFWWVVCKFADRGKKLGGKKKRNRRLLLCIRNVPGANVATEYWERLRVSWIFFSVGPKKTLDSTSTRPCPMPSKSLQFIHSSAYSVLINRYDQESKVKKKTDSYFLNSLWNALFFLGRGFRVLTTVDINRRHPFVS